MSTLTILLLVGLVVFITHALEAVTGFGCTVLAMPFVIAITGDIAFAKIILSVLAWLLALYIALTNWRSINWRQFGIIVLLAAAGMPLGIYAFKSLDANILTRILGGFIVLTAGIQLYRLWGKKGAVSGRFHPLNYGYLFAGGVVHGAFATGGPLIVLYSTKKLSGKAQFRATMCLLWASLNTILIVQYGLDGALTRAVGTDLLLLLPFLAAGIVAGEWAHRRVNEMLFKKVVFCMLLLVGVVMLIP